VLALLRPDGDGYTLDARAESGAVIVARYDTRTGLSWAGIRVSGMNRGRVDLEAKIVPCPGGDRAVPVSSYRRHCWSFAPFLRDGPR
jgi:hypothetical protein